MINPNVKLATHDDIERALLVLEQIDKNASNLLREHVASLESALKVAQLQADVEPGSWLYSWEVVDSFEPGAKERIWARIMGRIEREQG